MERASLFVIPEDESAAEARCCAWRGAPFKLFEGRWTASPDARLFSWLAGKGQDGDGSEATQAALQGVRAYPQGIGAKIPGERAKKRGKGDADSVVDGSWGGASGINSAQLLRNTPRDERPPAISMKNNTIFPLLEISQCLLCW